MTRAISSALNSAQDYLVRPFTSATQLHAPTPAPSSNIRRVFQTTDQMKSEFVKFLQTIFYQLDDKKVLAAMEKLLAY